MKIKPHVPKITSDYAILDVMKGRVKIASHLKKHGPIRVMVELEVTDPFGGNDGTSIEFNCKVLSMKVAKDG